MGGRIDTIDQWIASWMAKWGIGALRYSLAIIYIWFGILKPLGLSPAGPLVDVTVEWMPLLSSDTWILILGWMEVAIGVCFLFRKTLRIGIGLLFIQMIGAFIPLFFLPAFTFQAGHQPYAPTLEGQYIVKNLLIISAALVVGGTLRHEITSKHPESKE